MMKKCREICSECPHRDITTGYGKYIVDRYKDKYIPTTIHRCHKISEETFGHVNDDNVCIGSKITMSKIGK